MSGELLFSELAREWGGGMLSRRLRLRSGGAFREVYEKGRSLTHRWLVLHALERPGGGKRIGISASRRVGGAVIRNRARRRIRAICSEWEPHIRAGHDLVISVRRGAHTAEYSALRAALGELLSRAGVLSPGVSPDKVAQPQRAQVVQNEEEMAHQPQTGDLGS